MIVANKRTPRRLRAHRGITLLEVLISIGVAFTGLVGLVALVPLAAHFMRSGITADNAASLGRNSVSSLEVKGISRRDNWAIWNPNSNAFLPFDVTPNYAAQPIDNSNANVWTAPSFCVDPLLINRAYYDNLTIGSIPIPNLFPAVTISQPREARMARVKLREQYPGGPLIMPYGAAPAPTANITESAEAMYSAASDAFRFNDDLVFGLPGRDVGLPNDSTLPPVQMFSRQNNLDQKRSYDGTLTWMATFSPIVQPTGGFATQDNYLMSIVVFHNRVLDLNAAPEQVVDVNQFWSGGISGGDITIQPGPSQPNSEMKVRVGDWVMLSGRLNANNTPGASVFRWYRVVSADSDLRIDTNTGARLRDISLQGADWNPAFFYPYSTQVTLVSGVVAVFEKTVRLERPSASLWAPGY